MNTTFFEISNNTFETRGFPWGQSICRGVELIRVCHECSPSGRRIERPRGIIEIQLEKDKGTRWPDILGCGAYPLFIVTKKVLDDWRNEEIGEFPSQPVKIVPPLPLRLTKEPIPEYFWLDGEQMYGASMDFTKSGYVNVLFCPACGSRDDDLGATYDRQHSGTWPMIFVEGSWNGTNVFTTDLSPSAFFCTEKVLKCAQKHRHTNFRFVPSSVAASPAKGIRYLR